jgi:glycosyltransferase involved in cell wall biosynthesis
VTATGASGRAVAPPATIDVVVATYNRAGLLRGAIDSVLAQTVTDWRLVVVSDASTDDTADVVTGYGDPRVTFLECTPRRRPGGPRNVGLGVSSSPYVAYLDDDDRFLPTHLETVLGTLRAGAEWVVAGCEHVDDGGRRTSPAGLFNTVWHPDLQLLSSMFEPSRVAHSRTLIDKVGGWAEGVNRDDWELWLRFVDHGIDVAVAPGATVRIRVSDSTMRHTEAYAPHWYRLPLGVVPSEAAARAVVDALAAPENRDRARAVFVEDVRSWFAAMARSGRMVLPAGGTPERLLAEWDELSARLPTDAPVPLVGDVMYEPTDDGHLLFCLLPCLDDAHGERIRAVHETHSRGRIGLVRDVLARTGP